MTSIVQSRRIVWLVSLLTATGMAVVISTLTVVGLALWKVRTERAALTIEQARLSDASNHLRRFSAQSRSEIQSTLDGVEAESDVGTASVNFQRFIKSELSSHPDAAVVASLTELDTLASRLTGIEERADNWRNDYEAVNSDLRDQRTVKKLRESIAQLRGRIAALQKQHPIAQYAELNDQLIEFARLVEMLAGEEQIDSLAEIRDRQIKPTLQTMTRLLAAATADSSAGLGADSIDELRSGVLGTIPDSQNKAQDTKVGGLFGLRRDALLLRREREKLKTEAGLVCEDIDAANAGFAQSAEGRVSAMAAHMERSLTDGWRQMLVVGGGCSLVFLWLARLISRGIHGQVQAIDQARAEAEKGRLLTQKLMLEQQAAAVELEQVHKKLLETSRQAGMAEVATGVLHNVGNVLNSVNVSASLLMENIGKSRLGHLAKVVALIGGHETDLGAYITTDPAGKQIPGFLAQLSDFLAGEQAACVKELGQLQKNIEHIKEIVAMQQAYAGTSGFREPVDLRELAEDALRIHVAAMTRHDIRIEKEFSPVPSVLADKHKILQILVNLISNAKHAMKDSVNKNLTIRIEMSDGRVRASVRDTGYGIAAENLTRIFAHGFTTKKEGHGFGLHSAALAAKEFGGSLHAASDGQGRGALFTLELPPMNQQTAIAA